VSDNLGIHELWPNFLKNVQPSIPSVRDIEEVSFSPPHPRDYEYEALFIKALKAYYQALPDGVYIFSYGEKQYTSDFQANYYNVHGPIPPIYQGAINTLWGRIDLKRTLV